MHLTTPATSFRSMRETMNPYQKITLSFVALILTGAGLLCLPFATFRGITFVDALFTSTSAVCVTGLTVLDTAKDFTVFGKIVIAVLIQFGGLGIMTFSIAILSFMGGNYSIKWRFTLESMYSDGHRISIRTVLTRILLYTVVIELAFAAVLFTSFIRFNPLMDAIGHSLFHSISAFCNAGFSTFSDNIMGFQSDYVVLGAISIDVILGGIGFLVLAEIARTRPRKGRNLFMQYSLHTRVVLIMTAVLLVYGTLCILALEWNHLLKNLSIGDKIFNSFFQSMSCRTAGFNSIDIGALRGSTLFTMVGLMFIGGSPGSIAGGVKTTTIAVVFGVVLSRIARNNQVVFWRRSLDSDTINSSMTLIILAGLFVSFMTFILVLINSFDIRYSFMAGLFEVTSAFGTVGLSTGITAKLHDFGKLLLVAVMYTGRLGPFLLIAALTSGKKEVTVEYPEEHIMIG
jgi:trk system potassium uptake protein